LLQAFLDHLLYHGFADTSLRSAAAAIGTSGRILINYFGSKEGLLVEAMNTFQNRQQELVAALARHLVRDPKDHMLISWRTLASPHRERFLLLLLEMWVLALRDRRRMHAFLDGVSVNLRTTVDLLVASGMPRDRAEVSGTVYLAAMRGFIMDLLATGDRERIAAAVAHLGEIVSAEIGVATA
jgi:AcrR family transcriptional regulator